MTVTITSDSPYVLGTGEKPAQTESTGESQNIRVSTTPQITLSGEGVRLIKSS